MDTDQVKPAWGPKMAALPNERWRAFVLAFLDGAPPGRNKGLGHTHAARKAGFEGNDATMRKTAYMLAHDTRIQEAIQEEARKRLVTSVPIALRALEDIAGKSSHKDQLSAAKTILDRTGLHETKETKNTHEYITDDPAMLERVRQLATQMGLPLEKLIGRGAMERIAPPKPVLTVEFAELKGDTDE